jgi:hypothetical protein
MSEMKPTAPRKPDLWQRKGNIWLVSCITWVLCVVFYEATLAATPQMEAWLRWIVMTVLAVVVPFVVLSAWREVEAEEEEEKAQRARTAALEEENGRLRAELGPPQQDDPAPKS